MITVGAYEAKTHLSALLKRVEQGERITITKHGVPVAVLQPPDWTRVEEPDQVIAALKTFRLGKQLDGLSIREMIEQGRG
ncbi:MAG: type II toxin-antitoxin system prevent-host-death family antitoxin [Gemmatimonadetes bacterium]|nr:type II toxin-antitoxin system prevent-host-death family antitoxin [Gemmatimonadota bacterium]